MEQKNIREYNGQTYSIVEGAEIVKELDARTKYADPLYNSIQLLAEKLKAVELGKLGDISIVANQAAQTISVTDGDGNVLSTVSVAFLNNEGTTFFFNEATGMLELKNDDGDVLSSVPVSAFVSNLAAGLEISGQNLHLKDTEGNILSTVALTKATVGLGNVANKSEAEMVGDGPIKEALDLLEPKQIARSTDFTLLPSWQNYTIVNGGKTCRLDLGVEAYQADYMVFIDNDALTDAQIIITGLDGHSVQVGNYAVENLETGIDLTLTHMAGNPVTIMRKTGTNKWRILGGIY